MTLKRLFNRDIAMTKRGILLVACVTLLGTVLSACNIPDMADPSDIDETQAEAEAQSVASEEPSEGDTAPAVPTPTAIPATPDVPDNWVKLTSPELGISLFRPPDWEVAYSAERQKLDLTEGGGTGWMEIALLNGDTADLYNLDYSEDISVSNLMDTLLDASQEDGTFGDVRAQSTYQGYMMLLSNGVLDLLQDNVMIAVIDFDTFSLLITGHVLAGDTDVPDISDEIDRLMPLYEDVILNIGTIHER